MKIVIDIPDKAYKEVKRDIPENLNHTPYELLAKSIRNGTPLPKGHWIVEVWNNREHHTCSVCQMVVDYEPCYHYCPYCGAEMESD